MTFLDASYYQRGDIIQACWADDAWISGRVIGRRETWRFRSHKIALDSIRELGRGRNGDKFTIEPLAESEKYEVTIALNQPHDGRVLWQHRSYPVGMPTYWEFPPEALRLLAHDPEWDAFAVRPDVTAPDNKYWGTYLSGNYYHVGDPVWVWADNGWRPAKVKRIDRWISVLHDNKFRDSKGNASKSYRTWQVWPAVSESSAIFKRYLERRGRYTPGR
jgi:hypothetical protein